MKLVGDRPVDDCAGDGDIVVAKGDMVAMASAAPAIMNER